MQLVYTLSLHGIYVEPWWWETNGEVEYYRRSYVGPPRPGVNSVIEERNGVTYLRLELVLMTTGEGGDRDQRRFKILYIRGI